MPYVRELEKGEGLFFYSRLQAHHRGLEAWENIWCSVLDLGQDWDSLAACFPSSVIPCWTGGFVRPQTSQPDAEREQSSFLSDASNSAPITTRIPQNLGLGKAREEAALPPREGSSLSPIPNDPKDYQESEGCRANGRCDLQPSPCEASSIKSSHFAPVQTSLTPFPAEIH